MEHVCEDYVVASSVIKEGPDHASSQGRQSPQEDALRMVELADQLLEIASACTGRDGTKLHFRVGIHTGPVVGAIAGKYR